MSVTTSAHAVCEATGKRRYRSQEAAERMLAHLILHTANQRPCRAYPCDLCDGGWHLTSKPRRETEVRRATA